MPDVILRPFHDEDAESVVAALRENYREDYFYEEYYDREHLIRANREGAHALYVAETKDGEFVGVVGAKTRPHFPASYEMSLHVLRKKFQGLGLALPLLGHCVEQSLQRPGTAGVYGHCVSYHTITQRETERLGMTATAFWLGRHLSRRSYLLAEGVRHVTPKLHSVVVAKAAGERDAGTLFVPEALGPFVTGLYGRLGVRCRLGEGTKPAGETRMTALDTAVSHNTDWFVARAGGDFEERLAGACICAPGDTLRSHTVFLNMLDPAAPHAAGALRGMGYRFTGVHPLHGPAEYMLWHLGCRGGYRAEEMALTENTRALWGALQSLA